MHKQWCGCAAQNFQANRGAFKPEAVVLHRSGGSLDDIDARCRQAGTFSSAHYAIGTDGAVHQYVEESDTAFHAGVVVNPVWKLIKPGQNPNFYTIGIELAGNPGDTAAEAQYSAAADLLTEIARRCQILLDADHIVLHSEIRAERTCPGAGFERDNLLQRIQAAAAAPVEADETDQEVHVLRNTYVREAKPSTSARIVRVAPANSTEFVAGFTDQGERVDGNSYWYRTQDGNYLWAGGTDSPNPVTPKPPQPVAFPVAPAPSKAASCGIPRIDQLFAASGGTPITASEADARAIGAVQDLLTGHGFTGLPTVLSTAYGVFGQKTQATIEAFRQQQKIPPGPTVDAATLQKMVATPAADPRASAAYTALVLGFEQTGMQRILGLVSQMEGAGKFAALNRNTDRAGLSFGLIQWAQKPGRLAEILSAMFDADRDQFISIFGGAAEVAAALIAHCRKPSGGVNPKTGETINPSFDLVAEPWVSRFRQAALNVRFQQVQVQLALAAFEASHKAIQQFAPDLKSERSIGFMIDVANQFGDGGAAKLYETVHTAGMDEKGILEAIADATVERVEDAFKTGVRGRRDHFLQTPLLSDEPFVTDEARAATSRG
jgi:N-acetyl-anhydromuramyl-L-alanine amidase AmpD/peptidoglycan hydrolase-like protein with peptidoglycan-binding domain